MTTLEALELASTIQLVDEIQKRFDHFIIHGLQTRPTGDNPHNQNTLWRFKGNPHLCIGLTHDNAARIQLNILANETSMPAEEL